MIELPLKDHTDNEKNVIEQPPIDNTDNGVEQPPRDDTGKGKVHSPISPFSSYIYNLQKQFSCSNKTN